MGRLRDFIREFTRLMETLPGDGVANSGIKVVDMPMFAP